MQRVDVRINEIAIVERALAADIRLLTSNVSRAARPPSDREACSEAARITATSLPREPGAIASAKQCSAAGQISTLWSASVATSFVTYVAPDRGEHIL